MSSYNLYNDAQLLCLLQQSSEGAFTEIYNRYWEKLFSVAYYHSRNKQLAEEVTQDVFMSLWDRRNSLDIKELKAYLGTAAKFAIFKHLVRTKRRKQLLAEGAAPVVSLTEDANINAIFLKEYINGLVETLPEKSRIVYKFSREEGMNIPQIAEAMNISHKTVETHLTKALKTLRKGLQHVRLWTITLIFLLSNIIR
ncbi:MAG TPA: RNA polymerase sigma-70 factor [Chitinophagaceae bacterium]|jgi:RNA polymerase sigma-70 factor (ECF subfamily)|nr:RNA polymerase sigma-70 factor [Chitinophagaceae bacterium]